MRALVLRFDAPLMSFGRVIVDQHGFTDQFPTTSMLTGLLANALGWEHKDGRRLNTLQQRIEFAARWDVRPQPLLDYQTVDLGQPKMVGHADRDERGHVVGGWTTRGQPEHRGGGPAAKFGTHQRYRHYWADGLLTVALGLQGDDEPDVDHLRRALSRPARPLFLGRKALAPARPLLDPLQPVAEGADVLRILQQIPVWDRYGQARPEGRSVLACWPGHLSGPPQAITRDVYDLRDWVSQIPAGHRTRAEGFIEVSEQ